VTPVAQLVVFHLHSPITSTFFSARRREQAA
jgi:hypothetical protein